MREPFRRGHPQALCENPRQSCCICIAYSGRDQFQRVASMQHCLGNPQSPVRQVVKRSYTDHLPEVRGEARSGEALQRLEKQ